ncbi:MAG: heparinase II/III family protein [Siphonobacter sp.]
MKQLFVFIIILGSFLSQAQVTPRNLLGKTYSLDQVKAALLSREAWQPYPRTPEAWQAALTDSVRTALINRGEEASKHPFMSLSATTTLEYVREANRSHFEGISYNKRHWLLDMALAESIEGKGRFTDAIMNGIWSVCEESYWGVTAHLGTQKAGSGLPDVEERTVDLFAAETAAVLAIVDYLTAEKLDKISPLIRKRIYYETNLRIFEPIQVPNRYAYLSKTSKVNNWNPWIMSNWLTATLFLERDPQRRAEMVYAAMNGLDLYINGLGEDGATDEGPMYWFAAGGCVFDALETLQSASSGMIDIFSQPIIRNMASYVYKMHIANEYFVDFADAEPASKPDGLMLYRYGQKIKDDTLKQFGAWAFRKYGLGRAINSFQRQRQVWDFLTVKEIKSAPPASFTEVTDVWFPDVQVMTARSPKGLYVATHGGHNAESHNHNDVGDFILYANGQPVVIDAGRGTYTANTFSSRRYQLWFTQSFYHNLPIINGLGQRNGQNYGAQNVHYQKSPQEASLKMDIAKAYDEKAGVQSWNRLVKLNRKKETVEITEDYSLTQQPTSLQQVFLTIDQVDTTTPGKLTFKGNGHANIRLTYDAKRWKVSQEEVPLTTIDDQAFKTNWGGKPIQRIIFQQTKPEAKGKNSFVFSW